MLKIDQMSKIYRINDIETSALNNISLEVGAGEFVSIMGPSGCGKSTLLGILGLLDTPTSGSFIFMGEEVSRLAESRLTRIRRDRIGFVFQSFNLIDGLSVAENVEVALIYRGISATERSRRVAVALEQVGIAHRSRHLPRQLSGGQQQRVAVARALVSEPTLILADEPTGNLDTENGASVMEMLKSAAASGVTVVMVTHSTVHAAEAQRTVRMLDGRVVNETFVSV